MNTTLLSILFLTGIVLSTALSSEYPANAICYAILSGSFLIALAIKNQKKD